MRVIEAKPVGGENAVQFVVLSNREAEVLRMICEGRRNKEIGAELGISPATVAGYARNLRRSLRVGSRFELAIWGIQNPSALGGDKAPRELHPVGCGCDSIYCSAMRLGRRRKRPAA